MLLFENVLLLLKIENDEYKYKDHIQVSGNMYLTY